MYDKFNMLSYEEEQVDELLGNSVEYKRILNEVLIELVTKLKEFDNHRIFRDPVTDEDAPGYSEVIKNPMCLKTIEAKVGINEYLDLESLNADVSSKFVIFSLL